MKKIISLIAAGSMLLSSSAFAIDYGSEWAGYSQAAQASFSDVPADHWAYDNINRVVAKGWFDGYEDGTFHPNDTITRAEAMTVFVKFLGLNVKNAETSSYHDVNLTDWYSPYIETGKLLFPKETTYNGEEPFNPNMPMKRETTVYALVTALRYTDDTLFADQSQLNMFKDQNSISELIKPYMVVAVKKGLVAGYDNGTIGAQDPLTRAEFATLLYRASYVGFGNSALNLEDASPSVDSIELSPSSPYQMTIGESVPIQAYALMSTGTREDYSSELTPVTTDSCITIEGTTIKAVSAGTGTVKFLNDANLADKTITVVVSAPTGSPVFGSINAPESVTAATATISGTVSDPSGSAISLDIDGTPVSVSGGAFSTVVNLNNGSNAFVLTAKNTYGASAVKTVRINRVTETAADPTVPTLAPSNNNNDTSNSSANKYLTALEWSVSSLNMSAGETADIKLYAKFSDGSKEDYTNKYSYSSTDESVVSVSSSGAVKAVAGGTARITFSTAVSASVSMPAPIKVTVKDNVTNGSASDAVLKSLEWSEVSMSVAAGSTKSIKLYGVYSDGSKKDLTVECGVYAMDDDIATVNGTTVKGVSKGSTELWFGSIPSVDIALPDMLKVTVID